MKKIITLFLAASTLAVIMWTQPVAAQAPTTCDKKWGIDSVKTIQNISVYREFFKQKNFAAAMESWSYVFANAPCAREQTHVDGVAMYKDFIKNTKDAARRKSLIDTLFLIYDVRAASFTESAGNALGRKGVDMLNFRPDPNKEVVATFRKSVQLAGNGTEHFILPYYFKAVLKEFAAGALTKEQVLEVYEQLSKISEANQGGTAADKYAESKQSLDIDLATNVIKDCNEILSMFGAKYKANPTNEIRDLLYGLLKGKGCTDKELFEQVTLAKYNEEPSFRLAVDLGAYYKRIESFQKSAEYYLKAVAEAPNDTLKAVNSLEAAGAFSQTKQFAKARQLALDASKFQPTWGKPVIFIGDLYASSGNMCGSGIEAQSVYWAAVDKYQRARNIDGSVSEEANQKIAKYSAYFPKTETLFFNNISKGSSYSVGCWIGETTTVRSSD